MDSASKSLRAVGISGCSSSGKTSICKILLRLFPDSVVIHQDDFYKPEAQ